MKNNDKTVFGVLTLFFFASATFWICKLAHLDFPDNVMVSMMACSFSFLAGTTYVCYAMID